MAQRCSIAPIKKVAVLGSGAVGAKKVLDLFGWEPIDCGGVTAARAIEPLCMLWCIPGVRANSRSHAFKLLR